MNKIIVIGPGGAGKSEMSRRLRDILNLPLYHLDNIFWKEDKTHVTRDEFDVKLSELLSKDKWIIDGDYSRTYEIRMGKADTIIFLDYPLDVCLKGVESRIGKPRPDIPWEEESFDPEFKQWIIDWFKDKRPAVLSLIEKYRNTKNVIVLHNREEGDNYLTDLHNRYRIKHKVFEPKDYEAVCDFLIELNKNNKEHINWNWARFEWMYEHPMFDKTLMPLIGLWFDDDKIVGSAIYDMYLGEASVLTLPEYRYLYKEILEYAYQNLKDNEGLKVAVPDEDEFEKKIVIEAGYQLTDQTETIMSIDLDKPLSAPFHKEMSFVNLDPIKDYDELCYLFWQGFDHGDDREECKRENPPQGSNRVHYNPYLSITVKMDDKYVGHVSLWFSEKTDYAYVEPVCVIPEYRQKGIGRAMIYEALNRARSLGAKKAYVISDQEFYEKIGFKKDRHYSFYQKM